MMKDIYQGQIDAKKKSNAQDFNESELASILSPDDDYIFDGGSLKSGP